MCGIAGAVGYEATRARAAVDAMCAQMFARGPDDGGIETCGEAVLGSRRLAIIDPSPLGHQPMRDADRGTTIVFNGMTYNFRELRAELERDGVGFTSDCDTEVVLKAYGRWGAACVERIRGMFAFAIADERTGSLFLARDRLGIKPLYYVHDGRRFAFASQVKALLAGGVASPTLAAAGVREFLAFGAVSEPATAIEGVYALPAAHVATFRDGRLELSRYWQPPDETALDVSREEAAAALRDLLADTVRRHLVSDVPLGVFLSGGVDSSVLAASASREGGSVRTVSVVFDDSALSEREHVQRVVDHIRSDHVWVPLTADDLRAWADDAFAAMDQPTFDGLNTYVVSRAAAQTGLKVALSGLGADELVDGYGHARRVRALETIRRLPRPVAIAAGRVALRSEKPQAQKAGRWLADGAAPGSSYALLRGLFLPTEVDAMTRGVPANGRPPAPHLGRGALAREVATLDMTNYMKNVLLRDTDAMSMACSLEVRVPYLDHELVEFVLRLPPRVAAARGKRLLVDAAGDLIPPETATRRKQGFVLPFADWMRGPLRDEVAARVRHPPAALADLLDARATAAVWDEWDRGSQRWLRPWALYALARWAETVGR